MKQTIKFGKTRLERVERSVGRARIAKTWEEGRSWPVVRAGVVRVKGL